MCVCHDTTTIMLLLLGEGDEIEIGGLGAE